MSVKYEGNISDFDPIDGLGSSLVVVEHRQVPSIDARDAYAVDGVAEMLCDLVDTKIPVFGIEDEVVEDPWLAREAHRRHQMLILQAMAIHETGIDTDGIFESQLWEEYRAETRLHLDFNAHKPQEGYGVMVLRLLTSSLQDAEAIYINARREAPLGDIDLYDDEGGPTPQALERGYAEDLGLLLPKKGFKQAPVGRTAQAYLEPVIYHAPQTPGSSYLFRTRSSLGPATAHGLKNVDLEAQRVSHATNLTIRSQH